MIEGEEKRTIAIPMVSIIMPAYNVEKIIERSIKSVLRQSFTNFELIVIDDASTDTTGQVVESFSDDRVHYIRREINHYQQYKEIGILDNPRNDGLRAARGEYISYLDADDMYRSSFLEIMTEFLEENPSVGLAYCDSIWFRQGRVANCDRPIDFDKELLRRRNIIGILEVMHRREIVDKVGFFNPMRTRYRHVEAGTSYYAGLEDWDYWFRVSEHFEIKHLPMVLADKIHKGFDFHWDKDFDPIRYLAEIKGAG